MSWVARSATSARRALPRLPAVQRPSVDIVVPFRGSPDSLHRLRERLATLPLRDRDSVLVVDNTPGADRGDDDSGVPVLHAADRATPAYARNRGAARGSADWLVFFDADAEPQADLLDRYFDPPPRDRTGIIGGGVTDVAVPPDAPAAARYAYLKGLMSQQATFDFGEWGYPKSANLACRRAAFDEIGGFRDEIRAAEDADLTYRLKAAGWEVERRENAAVAHSSRTTLRGFLAQQAVWGAGEPGYTGDIPAPSR